MKCPLHVTLGGITLFLDNDEKTKEEWINKEKHIKNNIIGFIIAVLFLIVVLIFFRTQIWAIISGLAIILGLIVNLITILNTKK